MSFKTVIIKLENIFFRVAQSNLMKICIKKLSVDY